MSLSDIGGRRPTPTSSPKLTMNQDEVLKTFKTALNHGSSFESALGKAAILADADNKALMLRTWPFFLQKYGPSSALYKEDL